MHGPINTILNIKNLYMSANFLELRTNLLLIRTTIGICKLSGRLHEFSMSFHPFFFLQIVSVYAGCRCMTQCMHKKCECKRKNTKSSLEDNKHLCRIIKSFKGR
jgi:hypothetical protein